MEATQPIADAKAPSLSSIQPYIDQAVARVRRHLASDIQEAFVIGVFGEWGSGKSFLLEKVGAHFPNEPAALEATADLRLIYPDQTLCVRFNPWRFEKEPHLLVPLLKTTLKVLEDFFDAREAQIAETRDPAQKAVAAIDEATDGKPLKWLFDRLVTLGNVTIAATKMVEIKAEIPGLGSVKLDPHGALKAIQEQLDYAAKRQAQKEGKAGYDFDSLYYTLHTALQEVTRGKTTQANQPKLNFLFLVDDIDRCLPDKAVEMLESIKLFLDIPGCAFLLALDDEVVERGIAHRYRDYLDLTDRGADSIAYVLKPARFDEFQARHSGQRLPPITGHEYLEKIVQLPFRLPRWSPEEVRQFLRASYPSLFPSAKPTEPDASALTDAQRNGAEAHKSASETKAEWLLELFVQAVPPVPRKLIRAAELLDFIRSIAQARGLKERLQDYTLAQLVLLQLFAPQCFRYLRLERSQAWSTLARRIAETREKPKDGEKTCPGHSAMSFFDWWQGRCDAEKAANPGNTTYLERTEIPFIAELRHATHNRSGFDPRNLFLADTGLKVDEKLAPYFSLFEPPSGPAPATVDRQRHTATLREPAAFVALLTGSSRDSWLSALGSEPQLEGRVLDTPTFELLLQALLKQTDLPNNDWLELVLPLLNSSQIKRLYRETKLLQRLADAAASDANPGGDPS